MDSDKKPEEEKPEEVTQDVSADALSKTPEELDDEKAAQAAADTDLSGLDMELPEKKVSPIKKFLQKVNIYLLIFGLLLVVGGAVAAITFFNSQKDPVDPTIESQTLTTEALKQLANTDASIGNTAQTLTIQGSAIINGQTLTRGNLNVAGNFQTGGSITGPTLTVSGASNLGDTQANSLQIAGAVAIQGTTTLRDLSVAGTSSFSGAVTASQLTVNRLIMSGNASLEIPNHISFTGASPSRSVTQSVLGNGGSASVGGSDTAGTININSGNNPTSGCFIRVNFNRAFARQPRVVISPVGSAAGSLQYYVDRNQSGFSVCSNNAPASNQAYAFDYFISN